MMNSFPVEFASNVSPFPRNRVAGTSRRRKNPRLRSVPNNVIKRDYWLKQNLPAIPPTIPFAGPVSRRVCFGIHISSGGWKDIYASECFSDIFATKHYKHLMLDSVCVWTNFSGDGTWIQLRGVPPTDAAPGSSAQQIFASNSFSKESRAYVGYHVPDNLAGPYGVNDVIAQTHSSNVQLVIVVSATFIP